MIKKLREKLAALAQQMRDLHALAEKEDRGFTAEERGTWDAMMADFEEVELRLQDAEKLERIQNIPTNGAIPNLDDGGAGGEGEDEPKTLAEGRARDDYNEAYDIYLRRGSSQLTVEHRNVLAKYRVDMEARAQSVGTDSEGGFTVPEGFAGFITETMNDFSGLLGAASGAGGPQLLTTASGNTIPFPTNDDTGNAGVILAENAAVTDLDTVFGERTLTAFMYTSRLIRVSLQLLQDEAVNLQAYLGNILGKRLGRAVSPHFAVGTGSGEPTGVATAAFDGAVDISAGAGITHIDLLDIEHALDPAYRRRGAQWVFNDSTLRAIKGLLDTNLRPLWLPADVATLAQGGAGPMLMGYGYIVDQGMESIVIGDRPIVFGDLSEFIIRVVLGVNLFKFEERFMDNLQKGFMGYARYDSNLIDTQAVVTDIVVA